MEVSDSIVDHLRQVASLPDLSGTRYELEAEIGRGGMGIVYASRDRELDRRVALKVLDVPLIGEPQLIARLEHPAIVPIYEAGVLPDGRAFYAMKLVGGTRLDDYAKGEYSLAERLRVIRRVGEALAFAHSRDVIHRDLKPQNVMIGEFGEVYVMDWGVEAVAGTAGFRAPEATLGKLSDVYSLGALLKYLVPESSSPALSAIAESTIAKIRNQNIAVIFRANDNQNLERFRQYLRLSQAFRATGGRWARLPPATPASRASRRGAGRGRARPPNCRRSRSGSP